MSAKSSHFDAIVIGVGGIGSAAVYHLAKRGLRVLGIEQFKLNHEWGSSHGHTRVIRQAYFEHPDYVPLLLESYRLWRELEADSGQSLLQAVGLVEIGPPDGEVISGVLAAAKRHQLDVEVIAAEELSARFPALSVPKQCEAVFEPAAGFLHVERCVQAHLDAARRCQAHLAPGEPVVDWQIQADTICVQTTREKYETERLVVCGGAWARRLLKPYDIQLKILSKHLHWFPSSNPRMHAARCPVFLYELPHGIFYGFPQIDGRGVKLAEHTGGNLVADADQVNRQPDPLDLDRVSQFARERFPTIDPRPIEHSVCLYSMSPDGHFIVDVDPQQPTVAFAAGLSGHGFKFAPVLGQALADLAQTKKTDLPIGFLSLNRFQHGK